MITGVLGMALAAVGGPVQEAVGSDVKVRLVRSGGEIVEEVQVKDGQGTYRTVLLSPTHPVLQARPAARPTAIAGVGGGLFAEPPTLAFTRASSAKVAKGTKLTLRREDDDVRIVKTIHVPATGKLLKVKIRVDFLKPAPRIRYLLSSYAFAPNGRSKAAGGGVDSTFSPGLRPNGANVVGDHFFRAPVIAAQKGGIAALMMPDLDDLALHRTIPTILDLDCDNGVVDAPLLSYGFADHRLSGHVYFTHDPSMTRAVPPKLELAYDLHVDAGAEAYGAYRAAVPLLWARYGKQNFDRVLPQAMPFEDYARACYPAAFNEAYGTNKIGWFEVEIDGRICGGVPSGWGFQQGWVSWQCWFNQLRSAWGLRWWGKKLGEQDWVDKADKMLNLALVAPMKNGAVPTTYQSREKQWKGSLIMPDPKCHYDLTNMAWKGIWMLRWLQFEDCPRQEDILRQCRAMADLMVSKQNKDGSIPTWLDKDLKVVPVLDRSAQTALPTWFLAELARVDRFERSDRSRWGDAARRGAEFLVAEVIDGQYYYDFETFFSCSPKACFQRDGKVDHEAMRDPHTLQAPQNTLCMQWAAEALVAAGRLDAKRATVWSKAAMKALDIMALYQNVWSPPYRLTAYTFGGFGVQNSDGEYLDARQAQFGCTLADFGARLGRADYFERGVAATRAAMTLINHPLHESLGLYPNPNYPYGLQPENCGHGGADHQNGRTGFDWGEGSGLASMAWLLDRFGPTWAVRKQAILVDGGWKGKEWREAHPVGPLINPVFDFKDWRLPGWKIDGYFAEIPTYPTRMDFNLPRNEPFVGTCENGRGGYDDAYTGTLTSPEFKLTKGSIQMLVGGGSGEGVYVELIDAGGKQLRVARGKNSERVSEVRWDATQWVGQPLRIRIVDRETGGWGHINVARIRCL